MWWMKRVPLLVGALVAGYWLVAFGLALLEVSVPESADAWWSLGVFRGPGRVIGGWLFESMERVPGWNYAWLLNGPFEIALLIVALLFGTLAWAVTRTAARISNAWR